MRFTIPNGADLDPRAADATARPDQTAPAAGAPQLPPTPAFGVPVRQPRPAAKKGK
ncbi:hypothetical protein ACO2I3_12340 [Leptospira interrogans]